MQKQAPKKNCLYCGKKFKPKRHFQIYCVRRHGQLMFWRRKMEQIARAQKIILEKEAGL